MIEQGSRDELTITDLEAPNAEEVKGGEGSGINGISISGAQTTNSGTTPSGAANTYQGQTRVVEGVLI